VLSVQDNYAVSTGCVPLKPLKHISPTQFSSLKECQLRAVLAAGCFPNLLPISPSSRLGIIVHRIIEMYTGRLIVESEFPGLWEAYVREQEEQMRKSWFERHLLPLSNTASDFHVKRSQCLLLLQHGERLVKEKQPTVLQSLREHWMESKDGLVVGRADEIRFEKDGATLIDYKTGNINGQSVEAEILAEYQDQLKLYAALFNEEYGLWPKNLAVVTLDGKYHEVKYCQTECLLLLNQAKDLLKRVNGIITTDEESSLKLASPSQSRCRYCLYRPSCKAYFNARRDSSAEGWPNDIWGTVVDKRLLLNGLGKLILNPLFGTSQINIRALKMDRHGALNSHKRIGVFSLNAESSQNYYRENQFTTIYGIEEA
jgi:hypothetical protein